MIIKRYDQGMMLPNGKFVCHIISEGGKDEGSFPPVLSDLASGSVWEDTSVDVELGKLTTKSEFDGEKWNEVDPLLIDANNVMVDVRNVNYVVVDISEEDGGGDK